MINKGDVVIVHEDNKPRLHWRLAIVEDLIKGNDDQVRVHISGQALTQLLDQLPSCTP